MVLRKFTEITAFIFLLLLVAYNAAAQKDGNRQISAETETVHEIIACGEDQVMIIDVRQSQGSDLDVVWTWKVSDAEGLPPSHHKYMMSTDDCKSVDNNTKILITSSHGGVVLVDRKSKETIFYARVPNAHSIEYLPEDKIAVALSTAEGGNSIEIYDAGKSDNVLFKDSLYSGHGLVWITERERLFALGYDELRSYSLKAWKSKKPRLVLEDKWALPETGGHDLTRISAEKLLLSTTNGVWVFDLSARKMIPFEPLRDTAHVKSAYYNETTHELIYTKGEISWWTHHIYFRNPEKKLILPDFKLYKVRVVPN